MRTDLAPPVHRHTPGRPLTCRNSSPTPMSTTARRRERPSLPHPPHHHRRALPAMTDTTVAPAADVASGLRARREAAGRLPPLDDGRCDPLDRRPQPRRRSSSGRRDVVSVRARADRALVKGWPALELLDAIAAPREWSPLARGYVIPPRYVADVLACAESRRVFVSYADIIRTMRPGHSRREIGLMHEPCSACAGWLPAALPRTPRTCTRGSGTSRSCRGRGRSGRRRSKLELP